MAAIKETLLDYILDLNADVAVANNLPLLKLELTGGKCKFYTIYGVRVSYTSTMFSQVRSFHILGRCSYLRY